MNLTHLTDHTLIADTKFWVKKEEACSLKVIHHIREVNRRKLFSDLGHPGLYEFCCQELGLQGGSAWRRIKAAEVLEALPHVEASIQTGQLTLTNVAEAAKLFNQEHITDTKKKEEILKSIENTTSQEAREKLKDYSSPELPLPPKEKIYSHKITLDQETQSELDQLKGLLAHEEFYSTNSLIKKIIKQALKEAQKKKFALPSKVINQDKAFIQTINSKQEEDRSSTREISAPTQCQLEFTTEPPTPPAAPATMSRTPTAEMKRHVYLKANGRCEKCRSHKRLQIDHRQAWALGGKTELSNLRLLCFHCNDRQRLLAGLAK